MGGAPGAVPGGPQVAMAPGGAAPEKKSGPGVVMVLVDTLCFLAAAAFAALLYIEFSKTL
tara:strand:- start:317 stop:496 length:180 start_codon:yes stop_codon:yes gene_type:complete